MQGLAEYVDGKMRAVADSSRAVDTQKVAVLAARAIADELYSLRKERGEREELLKEQAE
jgi:cell division protein ZapA (FtsZ GTPase activity inhibitor)